MAGAGAKRWYFSEDLFTKSPSRKLMVSADKEESYRQQAANFIQDMGQRLQVTQLCINTAIVYMQRFYMFHSFTKFHRNFIAAAALFLAAKVEEQPRKLEHVIKVSYICLHRDSPQLDSKSEQYLTEAQELVSNENILLQTLGFDVAIDHPHTHVVKCCQLVKASKELAQTSYFMATNSLHLTTMCLRYPPTIVACVCIHLACKWSKYEIPISGEGKAWYTYVDPNANLDQIEKLTKEFLTIFDKCPSRLKKKILQSHNDTQAQEKERERENTQGNIYNEDFTRMPKTVGSSSSSSSSKQSTSHPPQQPQAPVSSSQAPSASSRGGSNSHQGGGAAGSSRPASSRPSSSRPATSQQQSTASSSHHGHESKQQMQARVAAQQQQAMSGKQQQQQQPPPHYSQQSRGYPHVAGQVKPGHQQAHGQPHPQAHVQQGSKASRGSSMGTNSHTRSHTADPTSHQGLVQSKEAHQPSLTRQTGRTSLPGPGHHSGQRSGHPQQGMPQHPQQGHHLPGPPPYREPIKHGVPPGQGKGSRIPSLFDLPDSPEKKGGGSSMPPGYPATGLPPPYPEASRPSGIPAQPLFPTNPLSPGFERHTKPRPPELPRGASLEPGELLDTPTPTHIKNMVQGFPFPKSHQQPGVPPGFPKMEKPDQLNTSLPTFPTAIEKAAPTSQLHQSLFDPDYDDFGDSTFNLGDLLTNSLADPKEETSKQRAPAENFTATCDLSALFEDQDSSQMSGGGFGNFGNQGASGGGFKQEQPPGFVKQEKSQEATRVKTESDNRLSSSSRLPSSPYKPVKKESDSKRRSAEKTLSGSVSSGDVVKKEKKSGLGGLFSPEPDSRPPSLPSSANQRPPAAPVPNTANSDALRTSNSSNQQQVRPTSTGGEASSDPVVNVQKLESIAPEFQQMLKEAPPSSILVTPDGQPSPRKREEERRKEVERKRGEEKEKSHDKRRTTSGHSSSHNSTQRGSSQPSDKVPSNHERSDKAASNHEKSSNHEKPPSASSHRPGPASVSRAGNPSGNPQSLPAGQPALVDPNQQQSNMQQHSSSGEKEHKKEKHKHKKEKKEKKDKKEKKEKRDKEEGSEVKSEKERETGGGDHKKHKKDKKKHKERERSREKDAKTPSLKIKMAGGTPSMSPSKGEGDMLAPIPKITLKLGSTVTKVTGQQEAGSTPSSKSHHSSGSSSSSSSSHKRKAPPSTTRLDGPAAKMARAIGTDPGKEAKFLETTDLMRKSSSSSHDSKKVKVSSNKSSHD